MRDLKFVLAQEKDLNDVTNMFEVAIKQMKKNNIDQWDEMYPDRELLAEDIAKKQLYIALEKENIIAAYVLNQECDEEYQSGAWQYPQATYGVIHRLCVNPIVQNQKIGTRTLLHIENELKAKGIESIRLDVFSLNPYALKMYEALNYTPVGSVNWRKGRFYLMEKKL